MIAASRWTRIRLVACGVVFGALFVAVGKRAFNLQVREAERLRAMAEEQYLREIELPPRRGRILDRNGAELASTADVDSIYCNPRRLPDARDAARHGWRACWGWIGASWRRSSRSGASSPGSSARSRPTRWRRSRRSTCPASRSRASRAASIPNRTLAATVMGHAGSDGRGLDGVELALDTHLRGSSSSVQGVRDALGRDLFVEGMSDAAQRRGQRRRAHHRSLPDLRHRARHRRRPRRAPRQGGRRGHDGPAHGRDPGDGVGAVVQPERSRRRRRGGARNRAITDAFEPGSTMKTFTIAAALDAGRGARRRPLRLPDGADDGGQVHHPRHRTRTACSRSPRCSSSRATSARPRSRGGWGASGWPTRWRASASARPTGVGLPGERAGVVRPVDKWGDIGFANVSFGQGITVTPLQMVAGRVGAIAAGGVYHQPRIVARVVQPDGTVETPPVEPDRRVMSEATARTMLGIMRGVTETGGTAKQAAIDGYPVARQDRHRAEGRERPLRSRQVGVVVRGRRAGAEDPRLAIIVVVDEPQGGHLGGAVAAPIFKEIAEQALRYLHVPPSAEARGRRRAKAAARGRPRRSALAAGRRGGRPDDPTTRGRRRGAGDRAADAATDDALGRRSGAFAERVGRGRRAAEGAPAPGRRGAGRRRSSRTSRA